MKFFSALAFSLLFYTSYALSSDQAVDSAKAVIHTHRDDQTAAEASVYLAKIYLNRSENDSARKYAGLALQLSQKANNRDDIGASEECLGKIELFTGRYHPAHDYFIHAYADFSARNNNPGMAGSLNDMALLLYYLGSYDSSMHYCNQALQLSGPGHNSTQLHELYYMKGCIYQKKGDFDLAIDFLYKSLTLAETAKDSLTQAQITGTIGLVNSDIGKQEIARDFLFDALKRKMKNKQLRETATSYLQLGVCYKRMTLLDSALYFYKLGLPIATAVQDRRATAYFLHNISDIFKSRNNFDSALYYSKKSIEIFQAMDDQYGMIGSFNNRGQIFLRKADLLKDKRFLKDALSEYQKSLAIAMAVGAKDWKLKDYDWISTIYEKMGDYKNAFLNSKLFTDMVDTVYAETKTRQVAEMQAKYEAAKKDKELAENKLHLQQQEISLAGKTNANRMLLAGVALLVLLIGFGSVTFVQRQKLLARKKEIEKQKAVEQTRAAIARDLHDDIGATLSSVQIMSSFASNAVEQSSPDAKQWMQKITENTGDILQNVRDIVWTMNPDNDKAEELILRMKQFAAQTLEPKNIQFGFDVDDLVVPYLNSLSARRNIFLVFKEAVNNAAKYSSARSIHIELKALKNGEQEKFRMTINDDGKGIDPELAADGNGLRNMKKRAEELGGVLHVNSSGSGTAITLRC